MSARDDEEFLRAMRSLGVEALESRGFDEPDDGAADEGEALEEDAFVHSDAPEDDNELFLAAVAKLDAPIDKDTVTAPVPPPPPRRRKPSRRVSRAPDDVLDLHRLKADEARAKLARFVARSSREGLRTVLVVTGKGHHSGRAPVLKRVVEGWIERQGKSYVRAYSQAPPSLGGRGAYLLELRSSR